MEDIVSGISQTEKKLLYYLTYKWDLLKIQTRRERELKCGYQR